MRMMIILVAGGLGLSLAQGHCRSADDQDVSPAVLSEINRNYVRSVKSVFERKCFDCHSQNTHWPWYASLPVVKSLIASDVREARDDMDMSQDFPFIGKGSPAEYLGVLEDVLNDGSMPPWRYRILHTGSALTEKEKQTIRFWIDQSREQIDGH
jgi:hypothetical protein